QRSVRRDVPAFLTHHSKWSNGRTEWTTARLSPIIAIRARLCHGALKGQSGRVRTPPRRRGDDAHPESGSDETSIGVRSSRESLPIFVPTGVPAPSVTWRGPGKFG